MATITYQIKEDPVFNEYDYIIGYDTIKDVTVNIAADKVDEYLSRMDDELISNVKVSMTIGEEKRASGEYILDSEYWNEPY